MEQCPRCKKFTIAHDGYKRVKRCMDDGCSCIIIDKDSYSVLRRDSSGKKIHRVKITAGEEKAVLKSYKSY